MSAADLCAGEAAEASSVVQKSQTLPALQSAQHASAASLAQSEPVLVSASDAESLRSAATTTAAQSCFAGWCCAQRLSKALQFFAHSLATVEVF